MNDIFLKDVEIQEIFKSHLTIESKVMSIETLFANARRKKIQCMILTIKEIMFGMLIKLLTL
ncbi:hypothetical protein [Mesobacillus zeae]|uniref:hypothetical protein n=1 Tax=Mesobacillus zeae TaxID=1917180 RepID=UPI0015E63F0A|nr:hypothetical protein [Mesobacillus zeae]